MGKLTTRSNTPPHTKAGIQIYAMLDLSEDLTVILAIIWWLRRLDTECQ
jgi:hypothetical protein